MRLVHLVQSLGSGGLESLVRELVLQHAGRGHPVRVVAFERGGSIADLLRRQGLTVDVLALRSARPRELWRLRRALLEGKPELAHLHGMAAADYGRTALLGSGVPTVAHFHTEPSSAHQPTARLRWRQRLLCRLDRSPIVAISEAVRSDLHRSLAIPMDRIQRIYSGVPDTEQPPSRAEARSALGLAEQGQFVLCIGSFTPVKRQELLLQAMAQLPEASLLLAGSGPLREELQAQAEELGLSRRVHFLGQLDDVRLAIAAADVLAVPSYPREGLSLAAIEAMRGARPVVATRVGGLPEVLADGETGLLVEPESLQALAAALGSLLEDSDRAVRMGRAGRERYRAHFTFESFYEDLLRVYKGAV